MLKCSLQIRIIIIECIIKSLQISITHKNSTPMQKGPPPKKSFSGIRKLFGKGSIDVDESSDVHL